MEVYSVVNGPVVIPRGTVLQLSDAQASTHAGHIQVLHKPGWFKALHPLTFEEGSVFGVEGELDAVTLRALTPPEMDPPLVRPHAKRIPEVV